MNALGRAAAVAGVALLASCGGAAGAQQPAAHPSAPARTAAPRRSGAAAGASRSAGAAVVGPIVDTAKRRGRVTVLHVAAPGFSRPREVWVYTPPVPDPGRLPIVYVLHGQPGAPGDMFVKADLGAAEDDLVAAGGRPFLIVAVDGRSTDRADTEWADAVDGTDPVETAFLRYEIPAVEGAHPRTRGQRAIAGYSMGGYGAVNLAVRHPELFGQVVSLGGYFDVDDPDRVFGGDPAAEAANTPDLHAAALRHTAVDLIAARRDFSRVSKGQSQHFATLLRAAGAHYQLALLPGIHNWSFVRTAVPGVERFLAAHWS